MSRDNVAVGKYLSLEKTENAMVPFDFITSVMVVSAMHGGEPAVMTS